ncbi:MAG: ATP-grasp domain-containing protein [Clostridia bacterium]|nr:ATP-grasp domain-containing protein [Clostridia bacterium]
MSKKITPVLLGADLNCYSMARAFHEAYGVRSHAFGKQALGESAHSKIIKFTAVPGLGRQETLLRTLLAFASDHADEELYLVPCTDEYALAVIENQKILGKHYFCPCPEKELAKKLASKEEFCNMCKTHGLPHPKTEFFRKESAFSRLASLPFPYPIIIKPASSVEYWRAPFEGMKKVYTAQNAEEAEKIISAIYSAGYKNTVILQELVHGAEDDMYVLTTYSDKNAKVRAACMGRVLLGEHTPKGLGNHVAILTEYHNEIAEKLITFLERTGYRGFANFDIIFDRSCGGFRVLELNPRQGRSNYYVTASGMNIAELLVCDGRGEPSQGKKLCRESFFWHTVPKKIIYRYITEKNLENEVRALAEQGKSASSLFYGKDLWLNPLRAAYVFIHNMIYFGKYNI